jgi:hypothetical protein
MNNVREVISTISRVSGVSILSDSYQSAKNNVSSNAAQMISSRCK